MRRTLSGIGFLTIALSLTATLSAQAIAPVVPEIDGGSLTMALGLLSGSVMILRSRRLRK